MCWAVGSPNDAARGHCRVCKILENRGPCPHELQVCTQRSGHPEFDVRHYVNSELRWTNHCGYCKWAKANPDAEPKQNRGWPGCCRAPGSKEWVMVKDPTVATIIARLHDVPIPDAVKHALDQASGRPAPKPQTGSSGIGTGTGTAAALAAGGKTRTSDDLPPPPPPAADSPARRLSVSSSASAAAPSPPAPRRANTAPDSAAVARALLHKKSGSLQQLSISQRAAPNAQVFSDSDSSSTVRSEFTDYLSDESEAELQRLALERAQLKREEEEFRAARARLAAVDTNPPIEWRASQPAASPAMTTTTTTRPRHGSNGSGGSGSSTKQASPKPAPAPAAYVARPPAQPAAAAHNSAAVPRVTSSVSEIQRAIAAQNRAAATGIQPPPRQPQAPRIRGG